MTKHGIVALVVIERRTISCNSHDRGREIPRRRNVFQFKARQHGTGRRSKGKLTREKKKKKKGKEEKTKRGERRREREEKEDIEGE